MTDADSGTRERGAYSAALVACIVATIAFSVYARTLLPGVDLGDTGGFQAAVLWPETSARQAYPLYYGLARPFVLAVSPDNPARGLNLFSAVTGGLAVGLLAYFAALVTGTAMAGAAAGLLLAFSHTFWTQSVIAEVYPLHLALVAGCFIALRAYQQRPGNGRLVIFFAVYATAFGNHLSMILLLVPFTLFLFAVHPRPLELLRPRVVGLAAGIALLASLQYTPNFLFVWTNIDAPPSWTDRAATFWFDTTKADWRGTMMAGIDRSEIRDRLAMWIWDARLQFGVAGLVIAAVGLLRLWRVAWPWALLLTSAYLINTVFAITYNVGDAHVFFLPGHLFSAATIAFVLTRWPRANGRTWLPQVAAIALIGFAAWRAWDTWPSASRQGDRRGELLVARLAAGIDDSNTLLLSDLDWQSENALLYSARYERRRLAWRRLGDVLPHLPFLVRDNHAIGRDIVLTGNAAARVTAAYGSLFPMLPEDLALPPTLTDRMTQIDPGTPYVLALLQPTPEERINAEDLNAAIVSLAGASASKPDTARFQLWAGLAGESQVYHQASDRPYRATFSLLGDPFSVRMESWLPFDTFRRAGFGHVFRGRHHVLTIERGVSLVWFQRDGSPAVAYATGLYAPKPRLRIPVSAPQRVAQASGAILESAPPPRD